MPSGPRCSQANPINTSPGVPGVVPPYRTAPPIAPLSVSSMTSVAAVPTDPTADNLSKAHSSNTLVIESLVISQPCRISLFVAGALTGPHACRGAVANGLQPKG